MNNYLERAAFIVIACLATVYFVVKAFFDASDTVDFKYIWLAGSLWNDGIDPYTEAYKAAGKEIFVNRNRPGNWFYPPNFWILSAPFATLPYDISLKIWRGLSAILVILGFLILRRGIDRNESRGEKWSWLLFYVYATASSAVVISISLGQTSLFVFLGVCMYVAAFLRIDKRLMLGALVLLALKPTIGLPLGVFLITQKTWRGTCLAAVAAVIVFCVPAFMIGGMVEVIQGFLSQLGKYEDHVVNFPPAMTGFRNLLHHAFSLNVPSTLLVLLCTLFSGILGILFERRITVAPVGTIAFFLCALLSFFVPLHTYDLVFLGLFLILAQPWTIQLKIAISILTILLLRPNNLAALMSRFGMEIPGESYFPGGLIISLISLALLAIAGLKLLDFRGKY